MDKTRTLPPLVRGRVTRILEFFVDKIKFFKNILLLTDNFDLVLQVQWWGESLPAHIRPKELQMKDRILKNSQSLNSYKEKYEIKTTIELFQSYLKTCEVLELSVLEAVENYIIGSAFIRNLINLLKNNNELISVPIFDYLGEEIGEVVIHVNFFEQHEQKIVQKSNETPQFHNDKKVIKDCDMFRDSEDNYLSLGEKTLYYDRHSSPKNYENQYLNEKFQMQNNQVDILKSKCANLNLPSESHRTKPVLNQEESLIVTKSHSNESLPSIKILCDSSKVLCFDVSPQQSKHKSDIRNNKIEVCNKFSSNSIKYKSKSKSLANQNSKEGKEVRKTTASSSNITKKQFSLKKEKQSDFKVLLSESFKESDVNPHDKQKLSLKEHSHSKVMDYLLGCNMSKDNEESALNDFKNMSPSHNLVDSISQLCLRSDNNSFTCRNKFDSKLSVSPKTPPLNFDLNNPIEKIYYEKFFSKSNSYDDLEVAEFLNRPENNFKLKKSESDPYNAELQKKSQVKSPKSCNKFSLAEDDTKNLPREENLVNDFKMSDRDKNCGRCKYYKKLSELDIIIESLKHFEQKMIMYEKNAQNPDALNKRKGS